LRGREGVRYQNLPHKQVPIHSIADNSSNFWVFELNKSISFGTCSDFGPGDLDPEDFPVLTEVGFELIFVKAVREMTDVNDGVLHGKGVTEGQVRLLSA
jgi:hypothetical protein